MLHDDWPPGSRRTLVRGRRRSIGRLVAGLGRQRVELPACDICVMVEDGDLQFGVPYRLPPRIAPGIHTVLPIWVRHSGGPPFRVAAITINPNPNPNPRNGGPPEWRAVAVLPPNTGNHYFSPGRGAVRI